LGWLVQNPFQGAGYTPPLLDPRTFEAPGSDHFPFRQIAATAASSSSSSSNALHHVTLVFYGEAEGLGGQAARFAAVLLAERRLKGLGRPSQWGLGEALYEADSLQQQQQQQQQQQRRRRYDSQMQKRRRFGGRASGHDPNSSSSSSSGSDGEWEEETDEPQPAAAAAAAAARPDAARLAARRRQWQEQQRNGGALTQHDVIQELGYVMQAIQQQQGGAEDGEALGRYNKRRLELLQLLVWWPRLVLAQELLQQSVWGVIVSRIMLMGPDIRAGPPVSVCVGG
jgi:hypothetical protein